MKVYPQAKVLLSVHDGDSVGARSMRETIWDVLYGDSMMADLSYPRCKIDPAWCLYIELMKAMWKKTGLLEAESLDAGLVSQGMQRYNDKVIGTVPPDRLLVWSPEDGWEPLCDFLGTSVPPDPLPRLNSRKMFVDAIVNDSLETLTEWQTKHSLFPAE